jgi:hypothetical protein
VPDRRAGRYSARFPGTSPSLERHYAGNDQRSGRGRDQSGRVAMSECPICWENLSQEQRVRSVAHRYPEEFPQCSVS